MTKTLWWEKGIRFECQGSGKCCVTHGQYGYVYMSLADRRRMARVLGLRTSTFTRRYCALTEERWHLKDPDKDCPFLSGKRCRAYRGRPMQCRTWPFWPEAMNARTWTRDIKAFCPGVGKGRLFSAAEIRRRLEQHDE